jgi:hypothetical protein
MKYPNLFFETRDSSAINSDSFDEQVTAVTAEGNVTGIEAFREYYGNYLTGFSDAEFKFIDVFGDGDKIVKHWNFKGTHDGELFGIPATNNKVDIKGTTIVLMKDGIILQEQDFFRQLFFSKTIRIVAVEILMKVENKNGYTIKV